MVGGREETAGQRRLRPTEDSGRLSLLDDAPDSKDREWFASLGGGWAPGFDTIFRIILEGALAERPVLAELTSETGALPVILRAKTFGESCGAVATIIFSVRAPSSDFVARVERWLKLGGATVEILGHARPAV